MGDCLWFGFKRQKVNAKEAKEYYYKASDLKQPEAMCALSILYYDLIMSDDFERSNYGRNLDSIPKDKKDSISQKNYSGMWNELEGVATLNYVTPFLIFQANQADRLDIWPLSKLKSEKIKIVKYVIKKHKAEEAIEFNMFNSLIKFCDNDACRIYLNIFEIDLFKIYPCTRCMSKKYCSEICKIF